MNSETIAINATKLSKSKIRIAKELKRTNQGSKRKKLRKESTSIDEESNFLEKKIENEVYKIVDSDDPVSIGLFNDFITIDGLTIVKDSEFQKIAKFLGYYNYEVQPYAYWLTIYFYNDETSTGVTNHDF